MKKPEMSMVNDGKILVKSTANPDGRVITHKNDFTPNIKFDKNGDFKHVSVNKFKKPKKAKEAVAVAVTPAGNLIGV